MTELEALKLSNETRENDIKTIAFSHRSEEPVTVNSLNLDLRQAWEFGRLHGRREMAWEIGKPVHETGDGACSVCHVWPCGCDRP